MFHTDIGPILFGLWYRPPCYGEVQSIMDFEIELKAWASSVIGFIMIGDMDVHHKPWLLHSKGITQEGAALFVFVFGIALSSLLKDQLVTSIYWIWFFMILCSY